MGLRGFLNRRLYPLSNSYLGRSNQVEAKEGIAPVTGYKFAHLITSPTGLTFRSPTYSSKFNVISHAVCNASGYGTQWVNTNSKFRGSYSRKHTKSIDADCTCGFYSFKNKLNAENYGTFNGHFSNDGVVLELVNSGKYIEYDEGYRSEIQRVSKVFMQKCSECYVEDAVAFKIGHGTLDGVCEKHALKLSQKKLVTFEEARDLFAMPEDNKFAPPIFVPANNSVAFDRADLKLDTLKRKMLFFIQGEIFGTIARSIFFTGVFVGIILMALGFSII